jgi:hypothetical protein
LFSIAVVSCAREIVQKLSPKTRNINIFFITPDLII